MLAFKLGAPKQQSITGASEQRVNGTYGESTNGNVSGQQPTDLNGALSQTTNGTNHEESHNGIAPEHSSSAVVNSGASDALLKSAVMPMNGDGTGEQASSSAPLNEFGNVNGNGEQSVDLGASQPPDTVVP